MTEAKASASRLLAFVAATSIAACTALPTSPDVSGKLTLHRDDGPVPCDSTIITDGTCRGGYIIPY